MFIRSIIVDDERKARELLIQLLKKVDPAIEVCASLSSVNEAVNAIEGLTPDLVFLDVEMPGESGFSLFEKLGGVVNFETIFTTAYSKYAIEAFRVNALDYILKPLEPRELQRCVKKAVEKITPPLPGIGNGLLQMEPRRDRAKNFGPDFKLPQSEKLMVPSIDGVRFFSLNEITRLEADGAYTQIFFKTLPSFLSSKNLGEYEEKLNDHKTFMRVHRSTIINTNEVVRFAEGRYITMSDEAMVPVSRHFKCNFLDRMKAYNKKIC